jgi:hypothetical protein
MVEIIPPRTILFINIIDFMWDKAYLLALRIIGYNFAIGLIIAILELIFNTRVLGIAFTAQMLSSFTVGGLYSQHQRISIPKDLKLWTSTCYALIAILASPITLALSNIRIQKFSDVLYGVGLGSILGFIFTYMGLSLGSHVYMQKIKN